MTQNSGKKRQMVVLPEVNPNTFLLFFDKGNSGHSWSLRDYSAANRVAERSAREFGWSSSEVRQKARFLFDAPTVDTGQLRFWHEYTLSGNNLFLMSGTAEDDVARPPQSPSVTISSQPVVQFPMLNLAALRALPKAQKRQDLERMLSSPDSEDWVTWNLLNLLTAKCPLDWWQQMVSAARTANQGLQLSISRQDQPRLEFWRRVRSPAAYERASRMRMRQSADPHIAARSRDPKPVEGDSEIDVVLNTNRHLAFIEAKLGSDISMRTTYDPCRNQIIRNIDCLLETACHREPLFWMLVRDSGPRRTYGQLEDEYRRHPETLIAELPHRDPAVLKKVAQNIAVIRWQDLAGSLLEIADTDSIEVSCVKRELRRRVCI